MPSSTSSRSLMSRDTSTRCRCGGRKWPRRLVVCFLAGYITWFAVLMVAHLAMGDLVSGWIRFHTTIDIRSWSFISLGSLVGSLVTLGPLYYILKSTPALESLVDGNVHSVVDSNESTFAEVCVEALSHLPPTARGAQGNREGLRRSDGGGSSPIEMIYPQPSAPPMSHVPQSKGRAVRKNTEGSAGVTCGATAPVV